MYSITFVCFELSMFKNFGCCDVLSKHILKVAIVVPVLCRIQDSGIRIRPKVLRPNDLHLSLIMVDKNCTHITHLKFKRKTVCKHSKILIIK